MAARLLLHDGHVVTVDKQRRVIPDGWTSIEGDAVSGLGAMADPAAAQGGDTVLRDLGIGRRARGFISRAISRTV